MDALEIMSQLERVIPYFQPIFSADEHKIIGYEVLGRFDTGDGVISLGPFFQDEEVPDDYRIEVDQLVLTRALDRYLEEGIEASLFINKEASLLMKDHGEQFIETLLSYEKKGLSLKKIVVEISEKSYSKNLAHLLMYYKTHGIRIAIDHIGEYNGNIHRFIGCSPDILKVGMQALRKNASDDVYKNVLYSLSMLARKIGASLLFESVEVEYQLQYAWKHGGRYYQGYYLQKPGSDFIHDEDILRDMLRRKCQEFILHEKRSLEKVFLLSEAIENELQNIVAKVKKQTNSREVLLEEIARKFESMCFRLYICDENGFELTPNYFKKDGKWIFQPEYLGKNWSWRPYFLENILQMRKNKKGLLSDLYSDLETSESIRTFSYPLSEEEYLFLDITYDFLYEQEGLLY